MVLPFYSVSRSTHKETCFFGGQNRLLHFFFFQIELFFHHFQPLEFLGQLAKYAATCPNPMTIGDDIRMHFPAIDEKELPDVLKMPEEEKQKLDPPYAEFFRQIISLGIHNGDQIFRLHFGVDRDFASFFKADDDEENEDEEDSEESMDEDDDEKDDGDEGMDNFGSADSDESME
jgi:hypothetical protein